MKSKKFRGIPIQLRSPAVIYVIAGVCALAVGASAQASGTSGTHRYPYDPVCPWGRLADGNGMLRRCVSAEEARALLGGSLTQARLESPPVSPGVTPPATASPAAAPSTPAQLPTEEPKKEAVPKAVSISLTKVTADTGELPKALKKLAKANEKLIACVSAKGALQGKSGEVELRFLVRERGRAEGTSVKRRRHVSDSAARCMASVLDRRFVGYPSAAIVGATLFIEVKR